MYHYSGYVQTSMNDLEEDFLFVQCQERKFTIESMVANSAQDACQLYNKEFFITCTCPKRAVKNFGWLRLRHEYHF